MNRVAASLLALAVSAGALAADAPRKETAGPSRIERALDKRVTLDFADTPVRDVAAFLADFSGVNFVLDDWEPPAGEGGVTFKCREMSLRLALEFLLKRIGLQYRVEGHAIFIATDERMKEIDRLEKGLKLENPETQAALAKPLTLDFADTPLKDVAAFLGNFTGLNFVLDVQGDYGVTRLKVSNMPLRDVVIYLARKTKLRVYAIENAIVFTEEAAPAKK